MTIDRCPSCGGPLEQGFAAKAAGLSFIESQKFSKYAFTDEDISRAGLSKVLPWKGVYFRAARCEACKVYMVDYGTTYDRKQANGLAKSLVRQEV